MNSISRIATSVLLVSLALLGCAQSSRADAPRVAVWDPVFGTSEGRFKIDPKSLDQVAAWLQKGGAQVSRVSTDELGDAAKFSAARFDALFLPGDSFPRAATAALQKFAAEGGVLVGLNARVPFNVAIAPETDGKSWTMSPKTPTFAWQSGDINFKSLGLRYIYNPAKHDQGVKNLATPLLKKYLPDAPDILEKLPSGWIVPTDVDGVKTTYYPLVRSLRVDGADTTPQLYLTQNGKRLGIISSNPWYTLGTDPQRWPLAEKTVVALAQIANDYRDGKLKLTPADAIDLPENQAPPEPMRHRQVKASVNPEGAKPVARWGAFDGGSFELGEPLKGEKSLAVGAKNGEFPRRLEAGATLKLALPDLAGGAKFLRIRGAYNQTGAALRADFGADTVWNEGFLYIDASGQGNTGAPDLVDVPAEFHRATYLPSNGAKTLTLSNPGTKPLYFDAVQIEVRPQGAPRMLLGLGAPFSIVRNGKTTIPPEVSKTWGSIRAAWSGSSIGPPDDPKRWDIIDRQMATYVALGAPLELLIERTPRWAAMDEAHLKQSGSRPHTVAPDPQKYAGIVERMVGKYKDITDAYEIWNEADSNQFYVGTDEEYITLYKTLVPIIKRLDPGAKIITTGMAGYKEEFVNNLVKAGVLKSADYFAFHPYAGKSQAWDVPFGQIEGSLYANGIDMEIYCNESGFVWQNIEWFTAPPNYTPFLQKVLLDKAMARLLSNKLNRLSVFHAGGDNHPFGLWDETGNPRPAYAVFNDYLPLDGGKRLDVNLLGTNNQPLAGVYSAASVQDNGKITIVVNPAEVERFAASAPIVPLRAEFNDLKGFTYFQGKVAAKEGKATLTPAAGKYLGFGTSFSVDPAQTPVLEIGIDEAEKEVPLSLKWNGKGVSLGSKTAGVYRYDLRALVGAGQGEGELTMRPTGKTVLDFIRIVAEKDAGGPVTEKIARGGPSTEFDDASGWASFFGKPSVADGKLTLTPDAGKTYTGFSRTVSLDPQTLPLVEVSVPQSANVWQLSLKGPDGKSVLIADKQSKGIFKADLRQKMANAPAGDYEMTLRAFGATTFDYLRFAADPNVPKTAASVSSVATPSQTAPAPLPVVLRIPLEKAGALQGRVRVGDQESPVAVQVKSAGGQSWAEVKMDVTGRSILTLAP